MLSLFFEDQAVDGPHMLEVFFQPAEQPLSSTATGFSNVGVKVNGDWIGFHTTVVTTDKYIRGNCRLYDHSLFLKVD
jgi:hypothetical protein